MNTPTPVPTPAMAAPTRAPGRATVVQRERLEPIERHVARRLRDARDRLDEDAVGVGDDEFAR